MHTNVCVCVCVCEREITKNGVKIFFYFKFFKFSI